MSTDEGVKDVLKPFCTSWYILWLENELLFDVSGRDAYCYCAIQQILLCRTGNTTETNHRLSKYKC